MADPDRAERLSLKVPKPPNRMAIPVAFPKRPEMAPTTNQWVDQIRLLTEAATAAVSNSSGTRVNADIERKAHKNVLLVTANNTENTACKSITKEEGEKRRIESQLKSLSNELVELLRVRHKAVEKVKSVQKPLHDLRRRLEFRSKETPPSEGICSEPSVDLARGVDNLTMAVDALQLSCTNAEKHAAYLDELANAMRRDIDARTAKQASDNVFTVSSTSALAAGDASVKLPPVSPRSVNFTNTSPVSDPQRRNHPFTVTETSRIADLVAAAIVTSTAIRRDLKATMNAVDSAVTKNAELVETSVRRAIEDTKALLTIIRDRMQLVEDELSLVEQHRAETQAQIEALNGPAGDNHSKFHARKSEKGKVRGVHALDPLLAASAREGAQLTAAITAHQQQLRALDANRERLRGVLRELRGHFEAKSKLLEVDQRILTIGSTPRPSSKLSAASAGSSPRRRE